MRGDNEEHRSAEDLENYSLGKLAVSRGPACEQHLLVCPRCRAKLTAIEPFNVVHYTRDGPFYSRVTKLRSHRFLARHWGRTLEGGKEFGTLRGAKAYLLRTFARVFPEHVCTSRCGSTNGV